jgi:nicotinic acid mononucleotide adenylyltransferase
VDIAAECRQAYGADVRLSFLCGRDAAERVAGWDYGRPDAFAGMLGDFGLLVAARGGGYRPPPPIQAAVRHLALAPEFDGVSATEVRLRVARGAPWEHMVPDAIRERVASIYSRS